MAPETESVSIESTLMNVIKSLCEVVCDIDKEKGKHLQAAVQNAFDTLSKAAIDKQNELIGSQKRNGELEEKVDSLEQEVSSLKRYVFSTQVEMVRGNVIIRTSKTAKDVSDYVCSTVAKSGATKPSTASFFIQQISAETPSKDKDKSPKKQVLTNMYKVHLGGKIKNDFFKGLATVATTRSSSAQDYQVSHDVPKYLYKQRGLLEKAAFSLRKEHKDKDIRTKVTLKGFNLVLFIRTKDITDWVNIENEKVSHLRSAQLEAKEGDSTPQGDVDSLIKSLEKF